MTFLGSIDKTETVRWKILTRNFEKNKWMIISLSQLNSYNIIHTEQKNEKKTVKRLATI